MFARRPDDPEMRDSVSFWVIDDRGAVGLPRIGIEAVAANWDAHDIQINVAFPDGRVFRLRENGQSWPAEGPDGQPTVLGAGGLVFRCVEPFDTWTMSYDGKAVQTSSTDLIDGNKDGPLVDVSFHVEAKMAVPPWVQGALSAEAGSRLKTSIEGNLMGGPRYEQLFRATGTVKVGADERSFSGTGLRIRRQGVRKLAGFWGHSWQSALFPSGRAFGYIAYPPRPDGEPTFNEGYVFFRDGGLIPARVVEAPWLTRLQHGWRGRRAGTRNTQRDSAYRWRDDPVHPRHLSRRQDVFDSGDEAGDAELSGVAAGRRPLSVGRRRDLRHAGALQPARQNHRVSFCRAGGTARLPSRRRIPFRIGVSGDFASAQRNGDTPAAIATP